MFRETTWRLGERTGSLARQMADTANGERLRQLRRERGQTQEQMAAALETTAKTYGSWERGGGISPPNAKRLARYFKVKPVEIVTPSAPRPTPTQRKTQIDRIETKVDEVRLLLAEALGAEVAERAIRDAERQPPAHGRRSG